MNTSIQEHKLFCSFDSDLKTDSYVQKELSFDVEDASLGFLYAINFIYRSMGSFGKDYRLFYGCLGQE